METDTMSCEYDDTVNYTVTVTVEDGTDSVVIVEPVNISESCIEDIKFCSVTLTSSSLTPNVHYTISVIATNIFGSSEAPISCTIGKR